MSEEIKKNPGMELGDAALSGVSGGVNKSQAMQEAQKICQSCAAHNRTSGPVYCVGGEVPLAEFLEWNIMRNGCPYYRVDNSQRGSVG